MKKLFLTLVCLAVAGCGGDGEEPDNNESDQERISNIELEQPSVDIVAGRAYQIVANTTPKVDELTLEWASSNTDIATITQTGMLDAKSEGYTTITVVYRRQGHSGEGHISPSGLIFSQMGVYVHREDPKPQNYTSFIAVNALGLTIYGNVFGYFDADGYCWKLAELGDLTSDQHSQEIIVEDDDITEVYLFSDRGDEADRIIKPFILSKNKKNILKIEPVGMDGVIEFINKSDPLAYPQKK